MSNDYRVQVSVDTPPRGTTQQDYVRFAAAECALTWSWGLQPATALLDWVSLTQQPSVIPLANLTVDVYQQSTGVLLHTFYGILKSVAPVVGSDGISLFQEFVDTRYLLQSDVTYGCYNMRMARIENGKWQRRYWHILPANADTQTRTYTTAPYTAVQILDFIFGGPTIESPWQRVYHPALLNPVYEVNHLSGKKAGTAVQEISERLGTVFTLLGGRYTLVWTLKGVGPLPDFPANSDNRRSGKALSDNPTRVRILGDRNLYQVLNLQLEPDWQPAWQAFYDLDKLREDLFRNESTEGPIGNVPGGTAYQSIPGDVGNLIGWDLAAARARTITVSEYAALRDARSADGEQFRDYRKFGGRSRLHMPAALYIGSLMFRAFRPPRTFALVNAQGQAIPLQSLELVERALVEVTHDPVTGQMNWQRDVISAGNGYAVVQGYQVGVDAFKSLRPGTFRVNDWLGKQNLWQRQTFQVDDSGEGTKFILFEQPVINSTALIQQVVIGGAPQAYPALVAGAVVNPPAVRAALCFAAERFSYVLGYGTKDDVENTSGLGGEFVAWADGSAPTEMPYADGLTATQKADQTARALLNLQPVYDLGGWRSPINGTQLSSVIDRVTVRYNKGGSTEEVDFTNERSRTVATRALPGGGSVYTLQVEPERDFDRRQQLLALLPGQRELVEEARQFQLQAAALRSNPRLTKLLLEAFAVAFGYDGQPKTVFIDPNESPSGTLPVGTPLYRESGDVVVQAAGGEVTMVDPVFEGVTILDGEKAAGPIRATATGDNGVVLARVLGPVNTNDPVGLGASGAVQTYVEGTPLLAIGNVLMPVGAGVTALVPVRVNGAGSTSWFKGEYLITSSYKKGDGVQVTSGGSQGTYVSIKDNPVVAGSSVAPVYPYSGTQYWALIALGVILQDACSGGTDTTAYVNASAPI